MSDQLVVMGRCGLGFRIAENVVSLYSYFEKKYKSRDNWNKAINNVSKDNELKQLLLEKADTDHIYYFIPDKSDEIIYYRKSQKQGKLQLIYSTHMTHLFNIIAKEILTLDVEDKKLLAKWAMYLLYYRRIAFAPLDNKTYSKICTEVISDMLDLITLIIDREYTLYKNYDTGTMISQLRRVYREERLMIIGTPLSNLNLRRRI